MLGSRHLKNRPLARRIYSPYGLSVSSTQENIEAHKASITRLIQVNVDLRAEQGRMKWVGVATVVLSSIAYFWFGGYVGLFVLICCGSVFFVGALRGLHAHPREQSDHQERAAVDWGVGAEVSRPFWRFVT